MTSSVERGRAAFARQAWGAALSAFAASAERAPLDAADHERLAVCAYLVGEDDDCATAWEALALSGLGGSTVTELSGPTSVAGGVG